MQPTLRLCAMFVLFTVPIQLPAQIDQEHDKLLARAEADVVRYFNETPTGKCRLEQLVYAFDGERGWKLLLDTNYQVAYHGNKVFWSAKPVNGLGSAPMLDQVMVFNETHKINWANYSKDAYVQVRPLSCCNSDPMLGEIVHPRYLGTGLEGVIGGVVEKSSRGIFADGGLTRISAEFVQLDGKEVLKGTYKWGYWDTELYFSTSVPVTLLKSKIQVQSNGGLHERTVSIKYRDWDCKVRYPEEIEYIHSHADSLLRRDVVKVTEFDTLSQKEQTDAFSIAAMGIPDGQSVTVIDDSCETYELFHLEDGELVPFTEEERKAADNELVADTESDSSADPPMESGGRFMLYLLLCLLAVACVVVFWRLTAASRRI